MEILGWSSMAMLRALSRQDSRGAIEAIPIDAGACGRPGRLVETTGEPDVGQEDADDTHDRSH